MQLTQGFFSIFFHLFIGCAGSSVLHAGFLQLQQVGAILQLQCTGFSLQRLLLLQSIASSVCGFQLPGSRAQAQQLWLMGLVAPHHARSSQIRDQTCAAALAGRFFPTEPPGKPLLSIFHVVTQDSIVECTIPYLAISLLVDLHVVCSCVTISSAVVNKQF